MKTQLKLCAATIVTSLFAAHAFAAAAVPESAANTIQAGESRDAVIQQLGQPEAHPTKWMTGDTSLVYPIKNGSESSNEALYVDLDPTGHVTNVVVLDNSDDSNQ
ncbi:MAG TPA: hypothetical protein VFW00_10120 [Rhodocyclaceae bacterium]|nr:hypothetical protein [Rhodocyclaceae bacterium]